MNLLSRRSLVAVLCLLTVALVGFAGDAEPPLKVLDASDTAGIRKEVGREVIVTGVVSKAAWSRSGKVFNIEFEGNDSSDFAAAVFQRSRERFDRSFNGDLSQTLTGATVRLKGEIQEYGGQSSQFKGRPEMVLGAPTQITILDTSDE